MTQQGKYQMMCNLLLRRCLFRMCYETQQQWQLPVTISCVPHCKPYNTARFPTTPMSTYLSSIACLVSCNIAQIHRYTTTVDHKFRNHSDNGEDHVYLGSYESTVITHIKVAVRQSWTGSTEKRQFRSLSGKTESAISTVKFAVHEIIVIFYDLQYVYFYVSAHHLL